MYPWYRDNISNIGNIGNIGNISNIGQFCGQPGTGIKTENGYSDCMLGFDQYTNTQNINNINKVSPSLSWVFVSRL